MRNTEEIKAEIRRLNWLNFGCERAQEPGFMPDSREMARMWALLWVLAWSTAECNVYLDETKYDDPDD